MLYYLTLAPVPDESGEMVEHTTARPFEGIVGPRPAQPKSLYG